MARSPTFAIRIIEWQRSHGRHNLPWQGTRDPYRVWLSEVMLQQTQVATVAAYYERFLRFFPDVRALALATLDDVLALWSGLGYYSRARNLHRCAQIVVDRHQGIFPSNAADLAALPGIGRSTAAAIASLCFAERVAILDGNVKRVLSRVFEFDGDLAQARHERGLWALAESLLPKEGIASYNQGLMDLGASICLARQPECTRCPARRQCKSATAGTQTRYPVKSRKLVRGRREHVWLLLCWRDKVWLERRPERGVWARLWSLPEFASVSQFESTSNTWPGRGERLPQIEHALTHFDWTLHPVRWALPRRTGVARVEAIVNRSPHGRWFALSEALALGLPAPLRRLLTT